MTDHFAYISSAYGIAFMILLGLAVSSFIQRRRLRHKQMQISDK